MLSILLKTHVNRGKRDRKCNLYIKGCLRRDLNRTNR